MTQVDFYTHAENKLTKACHLVAEEFAKGLKIFIHASSPEVMEKLDRMLWTTPAIGFIPHCRVGDPLAGQTPILIGKELDQPGHDDVLINLDTSAPPSFSRFQRLIEIVGLEEDDVSAGRNRYRFYRDRGYVLNHHDSSPSQ
jgi:DNA polymerase-3 subunit chi